MDDPKGMSVTETAPGRRRSRAEHSSRCQNSFPLSPGKQLETTMSSLLLVIPIAALMAIYCMAIRHEKT